MARCDSTFYTPVPNPAVTPTLQPNTPTFKPNTPQPQTPQPQTTHKQIVVSPGQNTGPVGTNNPPTPSVNTITGKPGISLIIHILLGLNILLCYIFFSPYQKYPISFVFIL